MIFFEIKASRKDLKSALYHLIIIILKAIFESGGDRTGKLLLNKNASYLQIDMATETVGSNILTCTKWSYKAEFS